MRAVVVHPDAAGRLTIGVGEEPDPNPDEAVVSVRAFSLNRGEIRRTGGASPGTRIGWDVAGVVARPAQGGGGPEEGQRVVGFVAAANGWAEKVAVPVDALAVIPDGVSDVQAATLPVAGLTALRGLDVGTRLLGRAVAITGATGGVGSFAVQLARAAGAKVVAQVRKPAQQAWVRELGAHEVVIGGDAQGFRAHGPYALAFDGLGGAYLGALAGMLDTDGVAVSYGSTASREVQFEVYDLPRTASLYGFSLFDEVRDERAGRGLERLLWLAQAGVVTTHIERTGSWTEVGDAAMALMERRFRGKAVLTVDRGA